MIRIRAALLLLSLSLFSIGCMEDFLANEILPQEEIYATPPIQGEKNLPNTDLASIIKELQKLDWASPSLEWEFKEQSVAENLIQVELSLNECEATSCFNMVRKAKLLLQRISNQHCLTIITQVKCCSAGLSQIKNLMIVPENDCKQYETSLQYSANNESK